MSDFYRCDICGIEMSWSSIALKLNVRNATLGYPLDQDFCFGCAQKVKDAIQKLQVKE